MNWLIFISMILGGFFASAEGLFPSGLLSGGDHSRVVFVVDKSKRFLRVYDVSGARPILLAEHPSDIGKKDGDKVKENDSRTPTGIYFLQKRLSQPEIPFNLYGSLALTTDYPNIFDKRDAKSGHGIWLHAVPDSVPLTRGSRGCVVVRDNVVKELEPLVSLRQTPLVIFDHLEEVDEKAYDLERAKYLGFFEDWRKAWETQDADSYIKYYDETFKNDQMNFKQWYAHKKKLKGIYKFVKVNLSEPMIIRNRNQVVIRTMQEYQSDQHHDYGLKTIHARWSPDNGFKIIREDWEPRVKMRTSATISPVTTLAPQTEPVGSSN